MDLKKNIGSKKNIFLVMGFVLLINFSSAGQVIDQDGRTYKTVTIGAQVWMSENLTVSHFRNGDTITEVRTNQEWQQAGVDGKPAWCYYNNDPVNGRRFGKLYNWYAVNDPRGLAPEGWHVPGTLEWADLTDFLGGERLAGDKMKSERFSLKEEGMNNESGLSLLAGGLRNAYGEFHSINQSCYVWSSTDDGTQYGAWYRYIWYLSPSISREHNLKLMGLTVRCIKD